MPKIFKILTLVLFTYLSQVAVAAELSKSQLNNQAILAKAYADEKLYDEALGVLQKLEVGSLDAYGSALVKQTYAYVYLGQGDKQKAAQSYQSIIDMGNAPQGMEMEAYYYLAKLGVKVKKSSVKLVDGDANVIKQASPRYPRRASVRGIEGFVIVEFTVDVDGNVVSPVVIEEKPSNTFNRSALSAIKKFKYKPKVVNGKAVAVNKMQKRFSFKLENK